MSKDALYVNFYIIVSGPKDCKLNYIFVGNQIL